MEFPVRFDAVAPASAVASAREQAYPYAAEFTAAALRAVEAFAGSLAVFLEEGLERVQANLWAFVIALLVFGYVTEDAFAELASDVGKHLHKPD